MQRTQRTESTQRHVSIQPSHGTTSRWLTAAAHPDGACTHTDERAGRKWPVKWGGQPWDKDGQMGQQKNCQTGPPQELPWRKTVKLASQGAHPRVKLDKPTAAVTWSSTPVTLGGWGGRPWGSQKGRQPREAGGKSNGPQPVWRDSLGQSNGPAAARARRWPFDSRFVTTSLSMPAMR